MLSRKKGAASRLAGFCVFIFAALAAGAANAQEMVDIPPVSIAGVPLTSITVDRAYSFSPAAVVIGGGLPRFEIENLPSWATFSSFSGGLYGTPGVADAGTYPDIRISVTDGIYRASLPAFAITVTAPLAPIEPPAPQPQSISLSWIPPTENTDGTPLIDLAGYRIYSGSSLDALHLIAQIDNAGLTRYVVESPESGWLFFAVTAVNSLGEQSDLSQVVSRNADIGLAAVP